MEESGQIRNIEIVLNLRHWVSGSNGPRHICKCEECKAIKQVCHLARIAIDKMR